MALFSLLSVSISTEKMLTAWKASVFEISVVRIFRHLTYIRFAPYLSVFSSNAGKIRTRNFLNTDTFHAVAAWVYIYLKASFLPCWLLYSLLTLGSYILRKIGPELRAFKNSSSEKFLRVIVTKRVKSVEKKARDISVWFVAHRTHRIQFHKMAIYSSNHFKTPVNF